MRSLLLVALGAAIWVPVEAQHGGATLEESFDEFHRAICLDEKLRRDRTAWPLEYVYPDETNDYKPAMREVDADDPNVASFLEYAPCPQVEPGERRQVYDNFEMQLRDTGRRAINIGWGETGAAVQYFYERRDGLWYLVRIRDMSM